MTLMATTEPTEGDRQRAHALARKLDLCPYALTRSVHTGTCDAIAEFAATTREEARAEMLRTIASVFDELNFAGTGREAALSRFFQQKLHDALGSASHTGESGTAAPHLAQFVRWDEWGAFTPEQQAERLARGGDTMGNPCPLCYSMDRQAPAACGGGFHLGGRL